MILEKFPQQLLRLARQSKMEQWDRESIAVSAEVREPLFLLNSVRNWLRNDLTGMKNKYPNRRSIRLQSWNYEWPGYYFITIYTKNFEHTFGEVQDGIMQLNSFGEIAQQEWIKTSEIRDNVLMDEFVIMPNHMHGIIRIIDKEPNRDSVRAYREGSEIVRAYRDTPVLLNRDRPDKPANNDRDNPSSQKSNLPLNDKIEPENPNENNINNEFRKRTFQSPTRDLGAIIRGYKAAVTTRINIHRRVKGMPVWHRNYYEHIIRNEAALNSIRYLILKNGKWIGLVSCDFKSC